MSKIQIIQADLATPSHQIAVVAMMDAYAADPFGDGRPLADDVRNNLIPGLLHHPTTLVFLAMREDTAVGIAVCFRGFSTFAAKPLINISDFFVVPEVRGQGVGRQLLECVEHEAIVSGCCKLTLEVQENNNRARRIYGEFGFGQAVYVKAAGGSLALSMLLPSTESDRTRQEQAT